MKKIYIALASLTVIAFAALVVAWAFDTDGGFNIWQRGTCSDQNGNRTDFCKTPTFLIEYYPINSTNTTYCGYSQVNCAAYNTTCSTGRCVG